MKKIISTVIAVILLIGITAGISFEIYAGSMPKTSITKITALEESFKVEMKKADKVTGYQVQYSTSSNSLKKHKGSKNTEHIFCAKESEGQSEILCQSKNI